MKLLSSVFGTVMFLLILPGIAHTQKENNNWYMGYHNRLDFNNSPPAISYIPGFMGSTASVSSRTTGMPLFYTNGLQVYDRRDSIMQNGDNLIGAGAYQANGSPALYAYEGVVIVPFLNDTNRFYIFHSQASYVVVSGLPPQTNKLYYSVVDMRLNNGYGDVVAGQKNIMLDDSTSSGMLVLASDHCTTYLLTHHASLNYFRTFEITASGVSTPVISANPRFCYVPYRSTATTYSYNGFVSLKCSNDYEKVYMTTFDASLLYSFNRTNGTVSGQRIIDTLDPAVTWNGLLVGCAFSPDGGKVFGYTGVDSAGNLGRYRLCYYDLSLPWPGNSHRVFVSYCPQPVDIKQGPDRSSLYVNFTNFYNYIGKIGSPGNTGPACHLDTMAIAPNPDYRAFQGGFMPALIVYPSHDSVRKSRDTSICFITAPSVRLRGYPNANTYRWNNATNDSVLTIAAPGTYWVIAVTDCNVHVDTFKVKLLQDTLTHRTDTNICVYMPAVILHGRTPATSYKWDDGTTDSTNTISKAGTYWVRSRKDCHTYIDTFVVTDQYDTVYHRTDTNLCFLRPIMLSAWAGADGYRWSNNTTAPALPATAPGTYWVRATKGCRMHADTFKVTNTDFPVEIGNDTMICGGHALVLHAAVPGAAYVWQDASALPDYTVQSSGRYSVSVTVQGCTRSDSISVMVYQPEVSLGMDTMLCPGNTLVLAPGQDSASYRWQDGSTGDTYAVTRPGVYSVQLQRRGCIATDTIAVAYYSPYLQLGRDTLICRGDAISLAAEAMAGSTYLWSTGATTPGIQVSTDGVYSVTATNVCGALTDSLAVTTQLCTCNPFVPTAFTPNHDGRNDVLRAHVDCNASAFEFIVFNRYGQKVFFSYTEDSGWDGTINGEPADMGVYFYYLKITGPNGKAYSDKGDVTLIR